jgi:hypothetical protein
VVENKKVLAVSASFVVRRDWKVFKVMRKENFACNDHTVLFHNFVLWTVKNGDGDN